MKKTFFSIIFGFTLFFVSVAAQAGYYKVTEVEYENRDAYRIKNYGTGIEGNFIGVGALATLENNVTGNKSKAFSLTIGSWKPSTGIGKNPIDYNEYNEGSGLYDSTTVNTISKLFKVLYPAVQKDSRYINVLQLSIWKAIIDGGYMNEVLPAGYSFVTSEIAGGDAWVKSEIDKAFNNAMLGNYTEADLSLVFMTRSKNPKLGFLAFEYSSAVTPAPGALLLLGTGFAGIITLRRKFAK